MYFPQVVWSRIRKASSQNPSSLQNLIIIIIITSNTNTTINTIISSVLIIITVIIISISRCTFLGVGGGADKEALGNPSTGRLKLDVSLKAPLSHLVKFLFYQIWIICWLLTRISLSLQNVQKTCHRDRGSLIEEICGIQIQYKNVQKEPHNGRSRFSWQKVRNIDHSTMVGICLCNPLAWYAQQI